MKIINHQWTMRSWKPLFRLRLSWTLASFNESVYECRQTWQKKYFDVFRGMLRVEIPDFVQNVEITPRDLSGNWRKNHQFTIRTWKPLFRLRLSWTFASFNESVYECRQTWQKKYFDVFRGMLKIEIPDFVQNVEITPRDLVRKLT